MLRLALLCIVAAAVAAVAADQNTAAASDVDACKGEPGELGESALVQLGTAAQKGIGGAATEAIEASNSTSNEKSSDESTSSRRRRSRRRRSRRRAGTYTGTIPYKVQVYCGLSWLTLCSDVPKNWEQHTGAFDPSMSTEPQTASNRRRSTMNYITLGGDGVTGDLPTSKTITTWMSSLKADNLDFDLEGSIKNGFSSSYTLLSAVQGSSSSTKGQATCLVSQYENAVPYKDDFDYFGIMIHGSSMTSGSYTIPSPDPTTGTTWTDIQKWLDSEVPNEKIVLSLTTVGLEAYMVDWFKSLIAEYGLAGMSFWYWQGDDNQLDSSISIDCIQDQGTQCDSSSSFKCSQVCNGGDADGYCCDSDSITYIKGTAYKCSDGLEACCGGTDSTTYCQKV